MSSKSDWFRRLVLPGFAFKAVVIGGGYATGRELVTFFMPSGPWGGLWGMLLSAVIWSFICSVTFLFAQQTGSRDYRSFFGKLLGPLWPAFELGFLFALVVILAVFAAAAGAIGQALFGWPTLLGALLLMFLIAAVAMFGNDSVEGLFKYVSIFLYVTYAVFLALSLTQFGDRIASGFVRGGATSGWAMGGLTYAGYNVVGAVLILPVTRHLRSRKDALVAGILAGPLAMIPAILFFVCMVAYYPEISSQILPSDFLLQHLHFPAFRFVFQAMIFAALLESGTGQVHAINERIAATYRNLSNREFSKSSRLAVTAAVLAGSVFVADRVGLVSLISSGYRWLAYLFLAIYVLPLSTIGLLRISMPAPGDETS